MLTISFFIATFSSIFWLIFSWRYVNFSGLENMSVSELYQTVGAVLFPLAIIWGLFAIIRNHQTEQRLSAQIKNTLTLLQKNTETTSNLCTALMGAEVEIKAGFILQQFDSLISDINELLADIIKRSNSISSTQMEHLWTRTTGGERWLMAKTFIETYSFQSTFADHLIQKAQKDSILKGSILEFQTKYLSINELLKQYDKQKLFYNMFAYGALGKVYSLIEPIAQKILNKEEKTSNFDKKVIKEAFIPVEDTLSFPSFFNEEKNSSTPVNPDTSKNNIEKGLNAIKQELLSSSPFMSTDKEFPSAPTITSFDNTQSALRGFRKNEKQTANPLKERKSVISLDELEKEINASPENNYDEYAYPFGAWVNDKTNK